MDSYVKQVSPVDLEIIEIALGMVPVANQIIEIADGHTFQVDYVTPYYVYLKEVEVA